MREWQITEKQFDMHQSFVVPAPTVPVNSRAFNFLVFKALLNALHCGQIYGKIFTKCPSTPEQVFVSWNSRLSIAKINLYLCHGKKFGLLDIQLNSKVKYHCQL